MSETSFSKATAEVATDAILTSTLKEQAEKGPDLRHDHSKSHGLVWGELTVAPDIPEALRAGIFAVARTYPVWLRFSNGSGVPKRGHLTPDTQPDLRGLALKVLDVPGEKLQPDEQSTQDFILLNHPVFIVHNVQGFANLGILGSGQAGPELLQEMAPTLAVLKEATSKTVYNPILVQYWSTTPYKLGSQAIKFSLKPQQADTAPTTPPTSENYLREALVRYLTDEGKEAVFDFLVQVFVSEEKTPIEDPMQEWKAEDAPFIKVATVRVPPQKFDFDERKRLDEGLSFAPWHSLPAHEPLGGINLARKKIYPETVRSRHDYTLERLKEPLSHTQRTDDPA
ncbi:catalase family protein [Gloeobacter kilaueensis]|uniref:Catalase n=1 Tax=Gloeobacter kilaueensis (strain ATCC BAA-2537 / CCAP 1431/1 / ULC 316 / JS1) TaxID=1183438 RepID=U5QR25_GLOK1|nr:catalase family protein [Gloeobacter kilaueensis]AGY60109.1 catalase [Gloeobacter kilaueensis JS1]